jgi:RNA polymerase sigma-70 factor (ECF subfamily)
MYLYGYAYQEISNELQIPLGTVKSRIFFARKELQKLVIKYYPELSFRLNVSANFE